jgi:hypothetical protein
MPLNYESLSCSAGDLPITDDSIERLKNYATWLVHEHVVVKREIARLRALIRYAKANEEKPV